ncbi:hypothetical protein ABZ532_05205 [Streptomyces sp. NPDC019396]|uniref:hypothetical protein n=1 Tax=Streptomyces sp. NPDC019396 TaxID=3154687 RepID=UPI0033E309D1
MIGSTTLVPGKAPTTQTDDHRLALLTARTGLEPDLALRYTTDPLSVLAEFGLVAAEPVYLDEDAGRPLGVLLESFDDTAAAITAGCNWTTISAASS